MRVSRKQLRRVALLGSLAAACHRSEAPPKPEPRAPEVGIVTLEPRTVLLTTELPGRTSAFESSEVRPQVSGILRARLFTEGQLVKKGQTLYQIDAKPYQATEAQARANVSSAEAAERAARAKSERYAALVKYEVVSQQDFVEAKAQADQSSAAVAQARAALQTATINLRYTEVPAPISGRIGRSLVTTGGLVTANQPEPLATIQRLDPMFVDLQQSSAELLALRRSLSSGGAVAASADVRLKLEDGSDYARTGVLQFAEATVDPNTSAVTLRARFDNPDGVLLPGMFVRALVSQSKRPDAILAPQPGVTRDPKGNATALVVGADGRVVRRTIQATRVVDDQWLVESGLAAGERLIVEGTDKVRPGQKVKAVPASNAQRPAGATNGTNNEG